MKKLQLIFALLTFSFPFSTLFAQVPQAIPYQAVARDTASSPIANQNISLRFSIHDVTAVGTVVYQETQSVTTNPLGLFTADIGHGTIVIGTFETIDWGGGSKFMQVEMDATGGTSYNDMGTQQMLSVPYALNAGNGNWTKSADYIYNSNSGNVGVGTANPTAKLDVAGNVKITDGTQGAGKVLKSDSTGLASWGNLTGTDIFTSPPEYNFSCPVEAGSVSTGSSPLSVVIAGNYAYVVNIAFSRPNNGSSVVSATNVSNPIFPIQPIAVGGNGLQVIDISNPDLPTLVGSVETGTYPFSLAVSGNYAYAVSYDDSMQIIDITNPALPTVTGSVATGDNPISVAAAGNYAYVVNYNSNIMQVIDITNPAAPTVIGSVATGTNPYCVVVSGNYAYVVNDGSNSLQVFNITNPVSPTLTGSVTTGVNPLSVAVSGNYAYVVNYGSNSLQVINITNPSSPTVVGTVTTGVNPSSVTLSGNFACLVNQSSNTMQVINISNPASPTVAGSVATGYAPISIDVAGNYACVANSVSNTLQVISLACSGNYAITVNPATGQTFALPLQWNTSDNNISNDNSGNVGIGTSSPTYKLDVTGDINSSSGYKIAGAAVSGTYLRGDGTNYVSSSIQDSDLPSLSGNYVDLTSAQTASGEKTWSSNAIFNGDVGIGQATPAAKLDIAGTIKIADGTQGSGKVLTSDANGLAAWSPSTSLSITETDPQVSSATTNQVAKWNGTTITDGIITDNGTNVGIGITTPGSKLEVAGGDAKINGVTIGRGAGANQSNTVLGNAAFINNTSGLSNTAIGWNSLNANSLGTANVAIGTQSLSANTAGGSNTACGNASLFFNTGGTQNTAVGFNALFSNTVGGNNTAIGWLANVSTGNLSNATAIGANATVSTSNSLVLGNGVNVGIGISSPSEKLEVVGNLKSQGYVCRTGTAGVYGGSVFNYFWTGSAMNAYVDNVFVGTVSGLSDRRLKENLQPIANNAISRVMQLKPTKYNFKHLEGTIFAGSNQLIEGFIADELQDVIPSAVTGTKDSLTSDGKIQPQTVNILPVVSVLTKAMQEQQAQIETLKAENEKLKAENVSFKTNVEKIKVENNAFKNEIEKIKAQLGMDVKAEK